MVCWSKVVHEPLEVPDQYLDPTIDLQELRTYVGMISAFDDAIGDVMRALDQSGGINNTLIVFFSDNGAPASQHVPAGRAAYFKGGKTQTTEGGTRVPCFWWFPRLLRPAWHDGLFHVVDILPTVVGLSGGSTAKNKPLDGIDVWPALRDGTASPRTEVLYNINPRADNDDQLRSPKASLRVGDWKLSYAFWHNHSGAQLFNLSTDAFESVDLSASNPTVVAALTRKLEKYAAAMPPPYQPWPPWQGDDYRCCDCLESWATGSPAAWVPWITRLPEKGRCAPPYSQCRIPPCYNH